VFFCGPDGSLRSNRALCQLAGHYGVDMFIGSTLQLDRDGNSSTVTHGRLAGFGGAPNMGCDARGRRHSTPAWLELSSGRGAGARGRKLVVQIVSTVRRDGRPTFVDELDAVAVGRACGFDLAPVMIYGDDLTHVVTEVGVAYLYKTCDAEERRAALAAVAGATPVGSGRDEARTARLREAGIVALPEDLHVEPREAKRSLLAAQSMDDLVAWSGGLYDPPERFRLFS
jgi:malonate decarboxylase alpha subunit